MDEHLFDGIAARTVTTDRLDVHVLEREGEVDGVPVVFVHGNCSSSLFWQPTMLALPVRSLAIDLRGFGGTPALPVDATRGLRDFADDVRATLDALGVERAHLVGWSMGAGVVEQVCLDAPERVASLALVAPVSPYGFGGTAADGRRLTDDDAGTGAGGADPGFVEALRRKDTGSGSPGSPRNVLRGVYVGSFYDGRHEDTWVAAMTSTATGEDNYPGTSVGSDHWPGFAPGTSGVLNTMSPRYCDLSGLADVRPRPPILWVRGDADVIVSDTSALDVNMLGKLGVLSGWPGEEVAPPQPMIAQTRDVLERYREAGGEVKEVVLSGVGHSPHVERPDLFVAALRGLVGLGPADAGDEGRVDVIESP